VLGFLVNGQLKMPKTHGLFSLGRFYSGPDRRFRSSQAYDSSPDSWLLT
jgi:hypothetical protein